MEYIGFNLPSEAATYLLLLVLARMPRRQECAYSAVTLLVTCISLKRAWSLTKVSAAIGPKSSSKTCARTRMAWQASRVKAERLSCN